MMRLPILATVLAGALLTATLVGCQSSPQTSGPEPTVPGRSIFGQHGFDFETPITLKADDTGIANLRLETREDGPGEVTYSISRVAKEYAREELPALEDLEWTVEPSRFTAHPDMTYNSRLLIKASPDIATGAYFLMVEFHFEGEGAGRGWIEINVE